MAAKRSIFEEVSEARAAAEQPQGGMIDGVRRAGRRGARLWLMTLYALVVLMIVVGGLTRLTDSGLSITEWAPISGAIPPLNAEDWQAAFDKYKQIPEYELQNKGMTLAEFKVIYWWEWGHRQLGRFIGLVWALGFVGLLVTRRMPQRWASRFLLLGVLGGLQGLIGWWMVSSGLGGEALDVASYRLAIHLGLAFVILGILTSYILRLSRTRRELMQARRLREGRTRVMVTILLYLTFIQILIGALVAGIDAGRTYIDWPLMAGGFFPPDPLALDPIWRNFFEDEGLVQWMHRYWGYLVLLVGLFTWWQGRGSPYGRTRRVFDWMTVLLFGQVVVGIVTVMSAAPWNIAIIHQGLAVILWTGILYARFLTIYPVEGSVRDGTA